MRLVVFAILPFVHSAEALVAFAAVTGIANSFFRPAVLAGVPNLVDENELASGTSLLQATDWLAVSVGPLLGGVIVGLSSPDVAYWLNAVSFLFSALLLMRIPARSLQTEQGLSRGHWRDLIDGFGEFKRSAALRTVLFGFGIDDALRRVGECRGGLPRQAVPQRGNLRLRLALGGDRRPGS